MPIAIKGVFRDGKIKPLEKIPYDSDREVVILFLGDSEARTGDRVWDDAAGKDFLKGYAERDKAYDRL